MTTSFVNNDYHKVADHCFCTNCGDVLVDCGTIYCPACGEELQWVNEDEPEVVVKDFVATHNVTFVEIKSNPYDLAELISEEFAGADFTEPVLVDVLVTFNDEPDEAEPRTICICSGSAPKELDDDDIFFYVSNAEELIALTKEDNGEDFVVRDCLFEN